MTLLALHDTFGLHDTFDLLTLLACMTNDATQLQVSVAIRKTHEGKYRWVSLMTLPIFIHTHTWSSQSKYKQQHLQKHRLWYVT